MLNEKRAHPQDKEVMAEMKNDIKLRSYSWLVNGTTEKGLDKVVDEKMGLLAHLRKKPT